MADTEKIPRYLQNEARRLLGAETLIEDDDFAQRTDLLYTRLRSVCTPKSIYAKTPVTVSGDIIDFGAFSAKSTSLARTLENCTTAYLMAATLGAQADRLIARTGKESMADAVIIDAIASAMADAICDNTEVKISEELEKNEYMTMRFSPGYGDLPLETSSHIITFLDAGRRIGLGTTESYMLVPIKSVTAIIGKSDRPCRRERSCASCAASDSCLYRKRGLYCGVHE